MALVPDQKFSTFQDGGTPTTGDIIVGLRGGINTKFNWVLPSSVLAITGTANQVLANGTSGSPVTGSITLTTPQDIATTSSPTFSNITLSGGLIKGSNGNTVAALLDVASAVNYVRFANGATGSGVGVSAQGSDTNISISLASRGAAPIGLVTGALTQPILIYSGTSSQHLTRFNMANTAADRSVTWQDASGTVAFTGDIPVQGTTLVTTTPYAVLESDDIILVDTETIAAPSSIVLPASPATDGQVWTIKDYGFKASTYHITISVAGGGTIDFQSTYTLAEDDSAVSIAWSESEAAYYVVSTFDTLIPLLRISGNSGTAVPSVGIITINGGTTGLTTTASGSTLSLTGVLISANGGTGVNNGSSTFTMGGNVAFSGAFTFTGTLTGNTGVTFPTSGTLATTSQLVTPAALTKTDDTNVTLTLGGSPSTALVNAASLTLGWTGQLAVSRGGTGISSFGTGVATALGQNVTGSGGIVLATSPTLVTPVLGVAAATSINFGGTALSNYTEGTFTPTLSCSSPGDLSVVYTNQSGVYTRIGRMVFFTMRLSCTPTFTTAAGQVQFPGLPFACVGAGGVGCGGSQANITGSITWPVGATMMLSFVDNGVQYISLATFGSAVNSSSVQMSGMVSGTPYLICLTGAYNA